MRREQAEKELESLTATYSEMLESRQEILAQNERLQTELQRVTKLGDEVNEERNNLANENWLLKASLKNKEQEIEQLKAKVTENVTDDNSVTTLQVTDNLPVTNLEVTQSDGLRPVCPHCGSLDTMANGHGKLRKDGSRAQRHLCNSCQKTFSVG